MANDYEKTSGISPEALATLYDKVLAVINSVGDVHKDPEFHVSSGLFGGTTIRLYYGPKGFDTPKVANMAAIVRKLNSSIKQIEEPSDLPGFYVHLTLKQAINFLGNGKKK